LLWRRELLTLRLHEAKIDVHIVRSCPALTSMRLRVIDKSMNDNIFMNDVNLQNMLDITRRLIELEIYFGYNPRRF